VVMSAAVVVVIVAADVSVGATDVVVPLCGT